MKRAKLSQRVPVSITYEMAMWLDGIAIEGSFDGRSATIRTLLQTIMDEDIAAHSDTLVLKIVEGGR